ncbi:MAG: GntR family transcriptional regulator [Oscillospiraceae bacterium]|nr:GntR family transcriptional regulator [Ruminococcus sp.]MBQ9981458.1 GntR family transcriptional regulator [Oscillospiraceae bacterium]
MEFDSKYPIYLQIVAEIKRKIIIGDLIPGSKLPSNNDLAMMYKVNPNTVQRIYKQLEFEGICFTKRGLGTFLVEDPNLPTRLKIESVTSMVSAFLEKMAALGFTASETINIIKDIEGNNRKGENTDVKI